MTTKGVMKAHEFKDAVFYHVMCDCGDPECTMVLEMENDDGILFLNLYKKISYSAYWQDDNWFKAQWRKIKFIFKFLFTGYVSLEETHVIQDVEQIEAFIKALQEGKEKLKDAGIPQDSDGVSA